MLREDIFRFRPGQFDLLTLRQAISNSDAARKWLVGNAGGTDINSALLNVFRQGRVEPLIESVSIAGDVAAAEVLDRWEAMGFRAVAGMLGDILVGHGPDDVLPWLANFTSRSRMVCRVAVPYTTIRGTGFLIGPNLVLTAYHVIEALTTDASLVPQLTLTFGRQCRKDRSGHLPGVSYEVVNRDWLLSFSRTDDLDYAVLQVDGVPGEDEMDGEIRGWVFLGDYGVVDRNFFVGLIHHPQDTRLCFSPGRILDELKDERRFHYTAISEAGSSGGPVFNIFWQIVAMHTAIDGEHPENPRFTVGVPAATLRTAIQADGIVLSRSPVDRHVPPL